MQQSDAAQQRRINQVYGVIPVAEDAEAELAATEAELEKTLKGCLETVCRYGRKLQEAESRYAEAVNRAGRRVYCADRLNAAARKLAGVVDHAVKFGN